MTLPFEVYELDYQGNDAGYLALRVEDGTAISGLFWWRKKEKIRVLTWGASVTLPREIYLEPYYFDAYTPELECMLERNEFDILGYRYKLSRLGEAESRTILRERFDDPSDDA